MNCGCPWGLQPHHIVPVGRGKVGENVPENGITLCFKCHVPLFHDRNYEYKVKESWLSQEQIDYVISKKGKFWRRIEWDLSEVQ